MKLTFVTGNPGKVEELQAALPGIEVVQDARGYPEIQADTLEAVAEAGAQHLRALGVATPFVLEDAGLFVDGLQGFPGVYSRYAQDTIGNDGVLRLVAGWEPEMRGAAFVANLCYVDDDVRHFRGTVRGHLADRVHGSNGFGYDPIFIPTEGDGRTFGEMSTAEKAALSHRGRAASALAAWLSGPEHAG